MNAYQRRWLWNVGPTLSKGRKWSSISTLGKAWGDAEYPPCLTLLEMPTVCPHCLCCGSPTEHVPEIHRAMGRRAEVPPLLCPILLGPPPPERLLKALLRNGSPPLQESYGFLCGLSGCCYLASYKMFASLFQPWFPPITK